MMTSRGLFTTQLRELITQQCGKQLLEKISMPALNTLGLKLNEKSYPFHHPLTVLFHNSSHLMVSLIVHAGIYLKMNGVLARSLPSYAL